ncbi:unnamed protein product, partial [Ranitomeya imitator]
MKLKSEDKGLHLETSLPWDRKLLLAMERSRERGKERERRQMIDMIIQQKFNQTVVTEFILIGFSVEEKTRFCLFLLISTIYVATIAANIFIIAIVMVEKRLHKPMYFFIGGLSFLELWYPSATVPRLIWALKTKEDSISLAACMMQFYLHFSLGATEMFLLTVMAYDRPTKGDFLNFNKIVSVIPSVVTPLLNPIIYTLRNQEVKEAVIKIT